jgi:Phosphorylase superfamily
MSLEPLVHTILVPQGLEYRAVCRGLRQVAASSRPTVLAIPLGTPALIRQLHAWQGAPFFAPGQRVLIMGLCGALVPRYRVGAAVLYNACVCREDDVLGDSPADPLGAALTVMACDRPLTNLLKQKLPATMPLVPGLTSLELVASAQEKHQLSQRYGTDVVDMESFAALQILSQRGVSVAVLRVVSDGSQHDLPDLTAAIDLPAGTLHPLPLAIGLLRHPIAAAHLIRGAMHGLKSLQAVTHSLVAD